jgi:hypothetical protein
MHDPIAKTGAWVKQMLKGHLNYFAVSGNHPSLWWFFNKVKRLWLASLKRRSQTARLSWERFIQFVARFFPPIRTIHPLPCHRFRRQNPREEPGALGAHAGIRAGGGEKSFGALRGAAQMSLAACAGKSARITPIRARA